MMWRRCHVGFALTGRMLLRNRTALMLIAILPIAFYSMIAITTGNAPTPLVLPTVSSTANVTVSREHEGLVFMGLAAVGFISAYLAFYLTHRDHDAGRRLLLCGFKAWELVVARLLVLACAVLAVSVLCAVLLAMFFQPRHLVMTSGGFFLVGLVYGSCGFLTGALCRRELEGVLAIVLLTNIDIGWLQNPVFYAEAQHQRVIRGLPGYFPTQVSITSAFSDFSVARAIGGSLSYAAIVLLLALVVYWRRVRVRGAAR